MKTHVSHPLRTHIKLGTGTWNLKLLLRGSTASPRVEFHVNCPVEEELFAEAAALFAGELNDPQKLAEVKAKLKQRPPADAALAAIVDQPALEPGAGWERVALRDVADGVPHLFVEYSIRATVLRDEVDSIRDFFERKLPETHIPQIKVALLGHFRQDVAVRELLDIIEP